MFGGVNPKQMQGMMKKMGISQEDIRAKKVIFETDEGDLVIDEPSVVRIKMQGQESYQVTGEAKLQEYTELFSEDDIKMVMDKVEVDREIVIEHLEKSNGKLLLEDVKRITSDKIIVFTPLFWTDNHKNIEDPNSLYYQNTFNEHKSLWTREDFKNWKEIRNIKLSQNMYFGLWRKKC